MWLRFDSFVVDERPFTDALGRAVALAQNLEHNCRYVIMIAELGKALEEERYSSLGDAQPFVEKLLSLMLGPAVKRFEKLGDLTPGHIDTLRSAKTARNYVVHEAAQPLVAGQSGKRLSVDLTVLRENVYSLAEGDSMVSRWSFEIQERHEPFPHWARSYARDVANWVLEPLEAAG